ncbi:MAG: GC-type dockerin domain-anchored protein [Phycisphaerales bacterium]
MNRIALAATLAVCTGSAFAVPDVICGSLDDVNNWGNIGGIRAYSVGTTACNIGTSNADWIDNSPFHPVIGVTMWKYDNETQRLTQLGVTQLKHSFASLQGSVCEPCQPGGTFSALGPGCSDPYGAGLNGTQGDLGPRTEVNPWTGEFVYPYTGINQGGNAIFKRIQVQQSDISDTTATFYVEGTYTVKDDFAAGTNMNNASYKRLNINQSSFNASTTGQTFRGVPAIYAWQAQHPDVVINEIDVPDDGRLIVASKATDLGDGTWRYDYGVYNLNSDKAAASFSVPVNTAMANMGFNDITYHSTVDQNVSQSDWAPVEGGNAVTWNTETEAQNPMGNAIRWGTMYNFWFETDAAPTTGDTTIGLFKSGDNLTVAGIVPTAASTCPADFSGEGDLNFLDVSAFLTAFGNQDAAADFTGEGDFNFLDVSAFLSAFGAGCP